MSAKTISSNGGERKRKITKTLTEKLEDLKARLRGVTGPQNGKYAAYCPSCGKDREPPQNRHLTFGIKNNKIVFTCHSGKGCSQNEIQTATDLPWEAFFPDRTSAPATKPRQKAKAVPTGPRQRIALHVYQNEHGQDVFYKARYDRGPKCAYYHQGKNGEQIWGLLKDTPLIPYRLPELLAAAPDTWVYIPEGEKNADDLAKGGLIATTNREGAGKWKPDYDRYFEGKRVAILGDYDRLGQKHVQIVARHLHGIAKEVRIVELTDMPDKDNLPDGGGLDVSDWLSKEHTVAELQDLTEHAPFYTPEAESKTAQAESIEEKDVALLEGIGACSDDGNAHRFVKQYGKNFRWCKLWKQWLWWSGKQWAVDHGLKALSCARRVARSVYHEAGRAVDSNRQNELAKWAKRSQQKDRLHAMLDLAKSDLSVQPAELDSDGWLFNTQTGTLNLRTGKLQPHRQDDYISKISPVAFDPDAQCPLWHKVLDRIFGGDKELIAYMGRLAGMCLTTDVRVQELFIAYGIGANGKNTFFDTLTGAYGDYAGQAPPDLLISRRYEEHSTELADLCGKRLVIASETRGGGKLKVQLVKKLTGDAKIKARFMHKDFFEFERTHKLILHTNNRPRIRETSLAIWRRLRLIPFDVVIPKSEQDLMLLSKLKKEWPGILAWSLTHCLDWQDGGLRPPKVVTDATKKYQDHEDPIGKFIAESCEKGKGKELAKSEFYQTFRDTLPEEEQDTWTDRGILGRMLHEPGITEGRKRLENPETKKDVLTRVFLGLELKKDPQNELDFLSQEAEQVSQDVPF